MDICDFCIFHTTNTVVFFWLLHDLTLHQYVYTSRDCLWVCALVAVCVCMWWSYTLYKTPLFQLQTRNGRGKRVRKTPAAHPLLFLFVCFTLTCKFQLSCQMRNYSSWTFILGISFFRWLTKTKFCNFFSFYPLNWVLEFAFSFSFKWINAINLDIITTICVCERAAETKKKLLYQLKNKNTRLR